MMGMMKPTKHSVAVVVRLPGELAAGGHPGGGAFVVRRPADPADPLAGLWGLPAISLRAGEDERAAGAPVVPQPGDSMTQYTACRFTTDPADLAAAAARGSLCAQLFLEDNSKKRPGAQDRG
jgi:hypothetical protein